MQNKRLNGTFTGNMLLSSYSKMCFKPVTRKDDLITLGYMMLFLIDECPFNLIYFDECVSNRVKLKELKKMKKRMTAEDYCPNVRSKMLYHYFKDVLNLRFDEEPYYDKLKFHLISSLMNLGKVPHEDIFH